MPLPLFVPLLAPLRWYKAEPLVCPCRVFAVAPCGALDGDPPLSLTEYRLMPITIPLNVPQRVPFLCPCRCYLGALSRGP